MRRKRITELQRRARRRNIAKARAVKRILGKLRRLRRLRSKK